MRWRIAAIPSSRCSTSRPDRVAREIAEGEGLGWHKRLIEGRDTFESGPFRLSVDMPRPVWDACP
jgi:hypothetical protein